jgi:DNA-directed RNA polymerase subunit RPC12/RpoP
MFRKCVTCAGTASSHEAHELLQQSTGKDINAMAGVYSCSSCGTQLQPLMHH